MYFLYMFEFYQKAPNSSTQASWQFCLSSCSWGWTVLELERSGPWNIHQLSWVPLPSRVLFHGTPSSRSLKKPKGTLLKSRAMILPFALLPPLGNLNSIISRSLQPRLPSTFTSPPSHPSLWVADPAEHLSLLVLVSLGSKSYQCSPGSSWIAYALMCCSSSRYWGGWSPPQEYQTSGCF